ncbi:MAG: sigma-70 family RNA polymerase sigma factor [Prevotella sp.]|nr:sigma-70 family RNA polymerase sigma factor [Prevotella sp.]
MNLNVQMMQDPEMDMVLWSSFVEGDRNAFEQLYRSHVRRLANYGMRFTGDKEEIMGFIHDLFLSLYINRQRLIGVRNVAAYLTIRMRNIIIDKYRKESRMMHTDNMTPFEKMYDAWDNTSIPGNDDDDDEADVNEQLSLLTSNQQKVIYYRFVENMSVSDIATLLDIKPQSVSNIIQRALTKMRKTL